MRSRVLNRLLTFGMLLFLIPGVRAQVIIDVRSDTTTATPTDSIFILKRQLQQQPAAIHLRLQLGSLYLRRQMLDEAETEFQQCLQVDSLSVPALTGLGQVHFQRQPSKIIPFERLKELLKQDHKSQAIKKLHQALKIDPNYLPARYYLARTYLEQGTTESLNQAQEEFKRIAAVSPNYQDLQYQLGYTWQRMGNYQQALNAYLVITPAMADYARSRIRMSEVYYELKDFKASTEKYFEGIETLDNQEMLDYLFEEQKIILTPLELNRFESAPNVAKKKLFKIFWKQRDPDPSTPENERLMEHFRRVKFARENFHFTAPPYYDDRGKIYIKYGPPDDRYNAPVGTLPAKDNESWAYESVQRGLVFDFVSEGGYFRQVNDLTDAALAGYGFNSRLVLASQLYNNRSTLSRAYSNLAVNFSRDKLNDFQRERDQAVAAHPGEFYRHNYQAQNFPFLTKWAQFRGDSNKTQVEVYISIPGLAAKFNRGPTQYVNYTDLFVDIADSNFNSIIKKQERFSIKIDSVANMESRHFLFQNNYLLPPGVYETSLVMTSPDKKSKGIQKKHLVVRNFAVPRLMLSDIQMSSQISVAVDHLEPIHDKKDLKIMPYPFSRVMKQQPLHLYFEIYHLQLDERNRSNFEVIYTVKTIRPDRNFWQKTIGSIPRLFGGAERNYISTTVQREGDNEKACEYIAFDLKHLDLGQVELQIEVFDRVGQQRASNVIEFALVK
ncbi:MAG: GWxTD domain-containing protein [candidate division KSB1 bacterium]|nr:GWxTD domain-containing protein [candidate division KSB1 bacterium]MDZ7340672.1 GWxTD domain-containing protein [candidate division KSB1 bacterium]